MKIIIDAENRAEKTLKDFNSRIDGLQPAFKTMAVAGTVAFAGLSLAVKGSLEAAGEAAKVQAQLGAVLKSTGGIAGITAEKAIDLSRALQKETTFGDEAILSAENLLLTFTKIGKDVFPDATKTVLDMSVALGQDTKSSAIQLGKALNDPIVGVSALRKVGVSFTEDQQNLIKSLVETGDLMGAQKMILDELAKEFGGSASAEAETFAGKMKQISEQVGDVKENIGNALLPALELALKKITPVLNKILDWTEANPELTSQIIIAAGALAGITAVVGTLGMALPGIIKAVKGLWAAFSFLAANPIVLVIAGLALISVNIYKIIDAYREMNKMADEAKAAAKQGADMQDKITAAINNTNDTERKKALIKAAAANEEAQQTYKNIASAGFFDRIAVGLGLASYDTGGIVPGPVGSPQLAVIHGGERVLTADEAKNGGAVYNIIFNGSVAGDDGIVQIIKKTMATLNRQATLQSISGI